MSKYKVGDKVVLTVTGVNEMVWHPYYVLNDNSLNILLSNLEKYSEPLSTYTEPLEAKIRRQAAEITRLLRENERLKAEYEKMSAKIDAYELYGDQHEEEYNQTFNQGAEAAWELARKIILNNGYSVHDLYEIFDSNDSYHALENYTYPEAAAKLEAWEKAKEEIKVGDIVHAENIHGTDGIVTCVDGCNITLMLKNGVAVYRNKNACYKTGRHIDIDSFLKQIGEE